MKLFPFALLAAFSLATGCDDEQDTRFEYVNVPLGSHDVVLSEQDVLDVPIGIPGENYRVESDDPTIVAVDIAGGAIRLTAGKIGSTMVRLADDGCNRALMQVEVRKLYDLTLEPIPGGADVLRMDNDGTAKELKILTGNGGYTAVSSAPEAVGAEVVPASEGGQEFKLVLTGKANAENVTVTVTDAKRKTATVAVRVTDPIRPVEFDVEGPLTGEYRYEDTPQELTFHITSGNGGYTVLSSNEGVATATLSGTAITLTVVGDGGTTVTVTDNEKESRSVDLWVPLNTDDPTPRISWNGYRADLSTPGTASRSEYATKKNMYWDQTLDDGTTDTYTVTFNGGWKDDVECVNATNRLPGFTSSVGGVTTTYDDKSSEILLTSLYLAKRIGTGPASHPHIYFITLGTADGKQGFIVHRWNE